MKRIIIPLLIGAIMILVVGCGGKAITLPFVIGDSYDTAQEYIYESISMRMENTIMIIPGCLIVILTNAKAGSITWGLESLNWLLSMMKGAPA